MLERKTGMSKLLDDLECELSNCNDDNFGNVIKKLIMMEYTKKIFAETDSSPGDDFKVYKTFANFTHADKYHIKLGEFFLKRSANKGCDLAIEELQSRPSIKNIQSQSPSVTFGSIGVINNGIFEEIHQIS